MRLLFLIALSFGLWPSNLSGSCANNELPLGNRLEEEQGKPAAKDKVLLKSGELIICEVSRISEKFVFYTPVGGGEVVWIERGLVKSVTYANGQEADLSQKGNVEKPARDWRSIVVTKDPQDVANMTKVADIKLKHKAVTREHYYKSQTLETSAEILAKREAAGKDASVILIIKLEHHRSYGDPPAVTLVAEAYK